MNILGNILDQALQLIPPETILHYKYFGRIASSVGNWKPKYLSAVEVPGSWQPIPRKVDYTSGYNLQKNYFNFFCSKQVLDLQRDTSSDLMARNGYLYQCQSITDWYGVDGWVQVLLVEIGLDLQDRLVIGFNTDDFVNDNENFEQGNFAPGT